MKWTKEKPTFENADGEWCGPIPEPEEHTECSQCGCIGNNSCGHECLDKENNCTLDECLVCPCCKVNPNHMRESKV